ncbi:HD-domain/PDEase-like protein [Backusella circina FSU 941]|nr:HD-domain/PDEase-like protein [Backusella circina FSU 941]
MNPDNSSVVIFHNQKDDLEPTIKLLHSVFSNVIVKSVKADVITELKRQQENETTSTLLLIDVESCAMELPDECPDLLLTVVSLLQQKVITDVVPIVCSNLDSPVFMVKCLHEGAADYLLKPLCEDVVKTLFLNVTRYRIHKNGKMMEEAQNTSIIEPNKHTGEVWSRFKSRLKGVFHQDNWLSKMVTDYYTPKPSVRRSSMTSMLNDRKEYLQTLICSWDFLPLDLDNKDLIQCVFMILNQVLETFPELESLRVPSGDLYHFIFDICNSYHSTNPYHNFRHAVDVLQANYYFLCRLGVIKPMCPGAVPVSFDTASPMGKKMKDLLKPLDIFALLMASVGHDVGHPGVNNNFMITTSTPLAILYNDRSVLESFHSMSFFNLLRQHCFSKVTDLRLNPEYATFRKIVVNSILATDMSMHDEYVQRIKEQAQRLKTGSVDFNNPVECEREKLLLCAALIKCADISNCARPFEAAKRWAKILAEEFFEQGDLERELGMTVLPINERGKVRLEDFQIGFKKCIALKLFEAVSQVSFEMSFTVDYINENLEIWEEMKKDDQKNQTISDNEKHVGTPNTLPPQPSPDEKCNKMPNNRPRSGI